MRKPSSRAGRENPKALSSDDPARALIAEITAVVPVTHWSFARFGGPDDAEELLLPNTSDDRREELDELREEFAAQRSRTPAGPRIGANLRKLPPPYTSGVALLFAGMRREFGVLRLMRSESLGPFSSLEVQALALALDASTDRLSGFKPDVQSSELEAHLDESYAPTMHILDKDLNIVLSATRHGDVPVSRLPLIIEDSVKQLVSTWTTDPQTHVSGTAQPVPFLTVHTQPLSGDTGRLYVGVLLGRTRGSQLFSHAASRFNFTTRELETLSMLVQGATLAEVATAMEISSSTVQNHVRKLLDKTQSRNRSEMIAKFMR